MSENVFELRPEQDRLYNIRNAYQSPAMSMWTIQVNYYVLKTGIADCGMIVFGMLGRIIRD